MFDLLVLLIPGFPLVAVLLNGLAAIGIGIL